MPPVLTPYGKREWLIILGLGLVVIVALLVLHWYGLAALAGAVVLSLLAFFRDPPRSIPSMRGQMVSPADGVVSSVHRVDRYEPFDGPAVCVRIFLSVLDVHVNRVPCHGRVVSRTHKPGEYLNALKAESAEKNESLTLVLHHPQREQPVAAVRQVAGAIARRIVCAAAEGEIYQRGQRFGMIKFGSTTELYLPNPDEVEIQVKRGDRVYGGSSVLAVVPAGVTVTPEPDAIEAGGGSAADAEPEAGASEPTEAERRAAKYEPVITRTSRAADAAVAEPVPADPEPTDFSDEPVEVEAELESELEADIVEETEPPSAVPETDEAKATDRDKVDSASAEQADAEASKTQVASDTDVEVNDEADVEGEQPADEQQPELPFDESTSQRR